MPRTHKERMTVIEVVLPEAAKTRLTEVAEELTKAAGDGNKVFASDIIRKAIAEYFERQGEIIIVEVDRGGYRRSH